MRGHRLFWRLFWSYFIVSLAALALTTWFSAGALRKFYLSEIDSKLEVRAKLLMHDIRRFVENDNFDAVDRLCKQQGETSGTRITVILPSGVVIGDTEKSPQTMDNHGQRQEVLKAFAGKIGKSSRRSDTIGTDFRYVAVPFPLEESSHAVVRTSLPATALDRTLRAVSSNFVFNGALVAGLVALVSLWVSRRISRPLVELELGAQRLARGELDHRLQGADIAEIDALSGALNRMAEQWNDRIQFILQQQNEQEAMLTSMAEGVLAVDGDGTVITMNPSCAQLLGVSTDVIRGCTIHEIIRKPDLIAFVEKALSDSATIETEIELLNKGNQILHLHATPLIVGKEKPIGALVILRDITRLRQLENVRRDFVANVSHELRTPITSIKGFVETLLDGALSDEASARRFLEIIARQACRLDAIIEDLLALSRLERNSNDANTPHFPTSEVRPMLDGAIEMCHKQAGDKQIKIECECDASLAAPMNSHLVEQALTNLLDNAIKYSDTGSTVYIRVETVDNELIIQVQDEGCGIERRHLPRLFERFYRVDKARSRQLGGTGLGLAIVKHIALAHEGSVEVESVVGQGSTFTLRLPLAN